jgi:hypothetical protein
MLVHLSTLRLDAVARAPRRCPSASRSSRERHADEVRAINVFVRDMDATIADGWD